MPSITVVWVRAATDLITHFQDMVLSTATSATTLCFAGYNSIKLGLYSLQGRNTLAQDIGGLAGSDIKIQRELSSRLSLPTPCSRFLFSHIPKAPKVRFLRT